MKVVILAGGLPSTVSEEDEKIPKPMAEIGGRPILWHIMKMFSHYGYTDFVICTGYKGDLIKQYFMDYYIYQSDITVDLQKNEVQVHRKKTENWNVTVVDTGKDATPMQRVLLAKKHIGEEPFIVAYGDCVSNLDINALIKKHNENPTCVTVALAKPTGRNAVVPVEANGELLWGMQPETGLNAWVNSCTYVFGKGVWQHLEQMEAVQEKSFFGMLAKEHLLMTYKHEGFWSPMETRRDRSVLEAMWRAKEAPWRVWNDD